MDEKVGNDYAYAYESPKSGHGEANGGFVAENDYKNSTTKSASNKRYPEKHGSKGCGRRCQCCIGIIICIICIIGVIIAVALYTSIGQKVINKVCGDTSDGGISGCPTDISIDIPSASTAPINVSWKEPSSASNTGLNSTGILSRSHSPGSSFPVNSITTVKYVFNDTIKSECTFNIEINVGTDSCICKPEISIANCPGDFIHNKPSLCGTVPVTWVEPTATDGCEGEVTVQKSHQPGSEFAAGVTTVSYIFEDSSQNQKTCEFDVSVSSTSLEDDTVPPRVFDCPEHIYEVLEPGQTTMNIWWEPPTASDGSGLPVTIQQTHSPGDQFSVGGYELVVYTFSDITGNERDCEFAVTLYANGATPDMDPPVISTCRVPTPIQYVSIPTGDTYGDFNVVWPVATDNDGQTPTVIATHQQGINSFPLGRTLVTINYYDTSGNRKICHIAWVAVRYEGTAPAQPTIQNCPVNVYREIPEGTSTRVCWEEPVLTDPTGMQIKPANGYKTIHPGGEFYINGCAVVSYVFYDFYGREVRCAFSVTIRAIGHESFPGEWSRWFDADNPSGYCDCEVRGSQITSTPCPNGEPIDAQCETVSGQDWKETGQVAYCCPRYGFYCKNLNQLYGQQCLDYRVRFKCP